MPGKRKSKIPKEFNRDTNELREIAEFWIYRSQSMFPDDNFTIILRTLYIDRFGDILLNFDSKGAFKIQLAYAKKYYDIDFTEIANNLIDDTETLTYLESIDPCLFKYVYNKQLGPRDREPEVFYLKMDNKGPVKFFDDIRYPVFSYSLKQFSLYDEKVFGDPNNFDENLELVYLLPSEDVLIKIYQESLEGDNFGHCSAEQNLEDIRKLLILITPKYPKSPLNSIKDLIEVLSREFVPKEANTLLENLEDDNYVLNAFERKMMKSKIFKLLRSKHINKYKDHFPEILSILEADKCIPIDEFKKICQVPSYYAGYVERSFKHACDFGGDENGDKKGQYYDRLQDVRYKLEIKDIKDPESPNKIRALILISLN